MISQQDQLDIAASYIKNLREKLEKLKEKKEEAMKLKETINNGYNNNSNNQVGIMDNMFMASNLPLLELRDLGSSIEVMLISGLNRNFMLYEVISVLEQEGAEVVSASFSTVGDKIFHTVHAQVIIY